MEPLLDWMAEAISEGAMELMREVTFEATFEWTASSRFSACNLIASVWVDGISLARIAKLKLYCKGNSFEYVHTLNFLHQIIWVKLPGQIIWIKLSGSNYLVKLSGSNYLDQIIWIK